MKELKGTGVAMITPFNADLSINFNHLEKLTNHIINGGVDYLVVMGTTGESATLSKGEKDEVLQCVLSVNASSSMVAINGVLPVVLGVGGNRTAEVCSQLEQLDTTGITAILSVSPAYNKPTQDGIYAHFKAISEVSPLPIILYNVPGRTASNMEAETTLRLAHDFENIIGIKEASGNLNQCMNIIKNRPEGFLVISGDDNFSLPLIASGGDGVISVVANAFPDEYSNLIAESLCGEFEFARKPHYQLFDIVNLLFAEGNPAGVKCALKLRGICEENVRLPLVEVSEKLRKELSELVSRI